MAKSIVYQFNGDPTSQTTEFDPDDETPIPSKDSIITKAGARWKVVAVNETQSGKAIPVFTVYHQRSYEEWLEKYERLLADKRVSVDPKETTSPDKVSNNSASLPILLYSGLSAVDAA